MSVFYWLANILSGGELYRCWQDIRVYQDVNHAQTKELEDFRVRSGRQASIIQNREAQIEELEQVNGEQLKSLCDKSADISNLTGLTMGLAQDRDLLAKHAGRMYAEWRDRSYSASYWVKAYWASRREIDTTRRHVSNLNNQHAQVRRELEAEIELAEAQRDSALDRSNSLGHWLVDAKAKIERLQGKAGTGYQELQAELAKTQADNRNLAGQVAPLQKQVNAQERTIANQEDRLSRIIARHDAQVDEINRLKAELEKSRRNDPVKDPKTGRFVKKSRA